ncbi:hypothetical protein SASPL_137392 [Salvia splendens]|uniref:Uncharacterized protein n=1 Tax=Salvia splendens TaxID=180675 RepID=A0A8X8WT89_SALSN|nr:hypothetical protein SASPL_137392 [Salvia splendens]
MAKLKAELKNVVGDKSIVEGSDISKPTINEVLRFHPVAPLLDTQVNGPTTQSKKRKMGDREMKIDMTFEAILASRKRKLGSDMAKGSNHQEDGGGNPRNLELIRLLKDDGNEGLLGTSNEEADAGNPILHPLQEDDIGLLGTKSEEDVGNPKASLQVQDDAYGNPSPLVLFDDGEKGRSSMSNQEQDGGSPILLPLFDDGGEKGMLGTKSEEEDARKTSLQVQDYASDRATYTLGLRKHGNYLNLGME